MIDGGGKYFMGRKVTMKDIAKDVGVSVATVSYVLNYSEKEKISHDTRLKVFEAVKRLGYVPNMAAKSLASKSSQMIGIIINLGAKNKRSKLYQYYDTVNELQRQMHKMGYDVLLLSTKEIGKEFDLVSKRSLDGVFVIGMGERQLNEIATGYYVPIVFVDGYLEDDLFFKILPDYRAVLQKAKEILQTEPQYIITEEHANDLLTRIIQEQFPPENIFVNRKDNSLEDFLQAHQQEKGIIVGELLALQAERLLNNDQFVAVISAETDSMLLPDTKRIVVSNKKKAEYAADVMKRLMNLEGFEELPKIIFVEPE